MIDVLENVRADESAHRFVKCVPASFPPRPSFILEEAGPDSRAPTPRRQSASAATRSRASTNKTTSTRLRSASRPRPSRAPCRASRARRQAGSRASRAGHCSSRARRRPRSSAGPDWAACRRLRRAMLYSPPRRLPVPLLSPIRLVVPPSPTVRITKSFLQPVDDRPTLDPRALVQDSRAKGATPMRRLAVMRAHVSRQSLATCPARAKTSASRRPSPAKSSQLCLGDRPSRRVARHRGERRRARAETPLTTRLLRDDPDEDRKTLRDGHDRWAMGSFSS